MVIAVKKEPLESSAIEDASDADGAGGKRRRAVRTRSLLSDMIEEVDRSSGSAGQKAPKADEADETSDIQTVITDTVVGLPKKARKNKSLNRNHLPAAALQVLDCFDPKILEKFESLIRFKEHGEGTRLRQCSLCGSWSNEICKILGAIAYLMWSHLESDWQIIPHLYSLCFFAFECLCDAYVTL